jgi:hypothetical protein
MSFSTDISSEGFPSPTLSDMTAATIPPSPPDTVDFDAEHYWEFVTFKVRRSWIPLYFYGSLSKEYDQVEGHLFRVPKYRFVEDSDHFSTLFDLENKLGQEYGLDDPHLDAVKLEDVAVSDFQTFLNVLYPRFAPFALVRGIVWFDLIFLIHPRDLGARPDLT